VQPGDLTAYGYEGSVLLAADVRVSSVPMSEAPKVAAEVSWLACRDVCVLGSASLEQSWPLPVVEAAFGRWRSDLPVGDPPFSMSTTGGLAPGVRTGELTVWLQWPEPPGDVDLFPAAGASLKVSDVKVQTRGSLTRIDLTVTLLGSGSDRPAGLAAVAAAGGPAGSRRSWEISIPISKS
jgi:DsbC/DsbD-like thiol-disulfide interchange protein